ncbi:MAG: hypothetical protein AAF517_08530 [Planctomycetota bacterium]
MSRRELILLVGGFSFVFVIAYSVFRVRPALQTIDQLREKIELNNGLMVDEAKNRPEPPEVTADVIDSEYQDLRTKVESESKALEKLEKSFVDPDDRNALNRLKRRIADLARASGVAILKNSAYVPVKRVTKEDRGNAKAEAQKRLAQSDLVDILREWKRPMDRLTVATDFGSLRNFLTALETLPSRVLVVSVSIDGNTDTKSNDGTAGLLSADLVLSR